jgi:NAD(P)-dependent dehydrogenase (short-subunit alcohol dehydrogenase family)
MASDGKIALVTGAGTGIGRAAALAFLSDGYRVALVGRRKELLESTAEYSGARERTLVLPADITDAVAVRALFARVKDLWGRLDVLFNNAGRNAPAVPMEDLTLDQWQAVVDVNLTAMFVCTQEAIKIMKSQDPRGGRIINNGSLSAHVPRPNSAPYAVTKHAVTGLTKCVSLEGRRHDIACGQIDIGNAASEMTEGIAAGVLQADGSVSSEPRIDAEHVGSAVLWMANLPLDANVQFLTIMATKMPFIGRG